MEKQVKDWGKVVGRNIRRLREKAGETQEELGIFIGYGPTTVTNYEKGIRIPDLVTAYEIVKHYQVQLEELLEDKPHES